MDGLDFLKKHKHNIQPKTKDKPVFTEDGGFGGEIEGPSRDKMKLDEIKTKTPTQPKEPVEPEPTVNNQKPEKRTCQYCDTRIYNSQILCDKCKEKRFREIWQETLQPLLLKETFFIKKDVADIDFPMNLNDSLTWYMQNNYFTVRKNGKINEYYIPDTPKLQEIPGVTKRCRTCNEIKPVREFYKQKKSTDSYGYTCIECDKKRSQNQTKKKQVKDPVQHLKQLLIDDMQKQHHKNQPINVHLQLLTYPEKIMERD